MKQVWKFTAAAAAVLCFSGGALAADHVMDADIVIVGAGAGGMTAGAAAVDNGLKTIVLEKNAVVGGGGGGRPNMAQAGGKNPSGIAAALEKAAEVVAEQVK